MKPVSLLSRRAGCARLLAAGLTLVCLASAAQATDAVARVDLNVRTGPPGTSFGVVDTLTAGEMVEVIECQRDRWCYVDHDGPNGWVSSGGYLDTAPADRGTGRDCRLELRFDDDRPRLSVVCDDPEPPADPLPAPSTDLACFYDGAGFTGAHFCLGGGRFDQLDNGSTIASAQSVSKATRARVFAPSRTSAVSAGWSVRTPATLGLWQTTRSHPSPSTPPGGGAVAATGGAIRPPLLAPPNRNPSDR